MEIKKIRLAVSHEVRKNIPLIQGSCSGSIVSNWVIKSGDTKKTAEIQIACVCSFASASRILGLSAKNVVHHSLFDLTFISRFHIAINCLKNIYYIYLSIYLLEEVFSNMVLFYGIYPVQMFLSIFYPQNPVFMDTTTSLRTNSTHQWAWLCIQFH